MAEKTLAGVAAGASPQRIWACAFVAALPLVLCWYLLHGISGHR